MKLKLSKSDFVLAREYAILKTWPTLANKLSTIGHKINIEIGWRMFAAICVIAIAKVACVYLSH